MKPFELSEQTARLVRCLQPQPKTTIVTYDELTKLVGFEVTSRNTKLVYARKILERDHAQVWVCIRPRVGIKRLTDVEIAERLPVWWLDGARNKLSRGGQQADVVEWRELDVDQQARFSVDCIQRELAHDALSKTMRRKMEKIARGTSNDLPTFSAVEWAISLSPKKKRD
jgi:hypothetical protein